MRLLVGGAAFAKTEDAPAVTLVPRFPPQSSSPKSDAVPPERGAPVVVAHATDDARERTRAELELELEEMRRQRDEALRVLRKVRRALDQLSS